LQKNFKHEVYHERSGTGEEPYQETVKEHAEENADPHEACAGWGLKEGTRAFRRAAILVIRVPDLSVVLSVQPSRDS